MTSKERMLRALTHRVADRVPICDSPWAATVARWKKEGMPEDVSPEEYFGYEMRKYSFDATPRFPVRCVEKTDEFVVSTTQQGGKKRNFRDYSTTPEILEWPIHSKEDWKEIRKRLQPDFSRVDWASGLQGNQTAREEGMFCCVTCGYGYDILQAYMKTEELLMAMAEDPGWVREMVMTNAELTVNMVEMMILNGFKFDGAFVYNDMGYRNAPLFSPDTYRKTHFEADRIVWEYFHSRGLKVFLHSCGNVKELVPLLIEAGLDCLQPLEVKSGMDLAELKEKYGDRLCFMGGIDVRTMSDPDPSRIEEEIKSKIPVAMQGGGYIYHSDHSVPKSVSLEQYRRVMELVRKYGTFEGYVPEETPPEPATSQAQKPAPPARKSGLFSRKKEKAAPSPAKPSGRGGLFGRKKAAEALAAPPDAAPAGTSPAPASGAPPRPARKGFFARKGGKQ